MTSRLCEVGSCIKDRRLERQGKIQIGDWKDKGKNITFTADYSTSEVYFLDTKIKFKGERLISELYSKPTAFFQYLHRTSYHPPHTFRSILKSQFIRIRRICSDIDDYWFHAERFSSVFRSRGFKLISINKIINDIAKTPRQTLFQSQNTQIPTFF